jgi:hypothetical protein
MIRYWLGWLAALTPFVVVVLAVVLAALVLLVVQVSPALVWFSRLPEGLG